MIKVKFNISWQTNYKLYFKDTCTCIDLLRRFYAGVRDVMARAAYIYQPLHQLHSEINVQNNIYLCYKYIIN